MTPSPGSPRSATPKTLAVIRLAILLGVVLFGAVVWLLQRQPDWTPAMAPGTEVLTYVGLGVWGAAAVGLLLLRVRWNRETAPEKRAQLVIVGWALGEAPALWGGVVYFLTGDAQRFFTGFLFLIVAFLLFPIPRKE